MCYVEPKLAADPAGDELSTITLSCTFYPARKPDMSVTESAAGKYRGRI